MKIFLFSLILCSTFLTKGYSQLNKTTMQAGISVLPIADVFKLFPDNKISGGAVMANFGFFIRDNLSVGINPHYAQASNSYGTLAIDLHRERQNFSLYGLNTYLRYYFMTKNKFLFYASASAGFGNIDQKITNLSTLILVNNSHSNKSIVTLLAGVGMNYSITKNIALEFNVPYLILKYISTSPEDPNFHTVGPTVGLQFYWK